MADGPQRLWRACHRSIRQAHAWLQRSVVQLTAPSAPDGADRRFLITVIVVSIAVFGLAARLRLAHGYPAGDEPAYLVISQTLQKYHSTDVMLDYRHHDYLSFYPAEMTPHVVTGPHGELLSLHNVGGPLLWLPAFVWWGRAGVLGFMVVVSALVVANIYLLLRQRHILPGYALATTLLVIFGSPVYIYASMSFVEPICALLVIYATRTLLAHRPHPLRIFVAASGLAFAPWVHTRTMAIALPLGCLLICRLCLDERRDRWPVLLCCLVPLVAGAVALEYNAWIVWHSFNPGQSQVEMGNGPFQIPLARGLAGTLYDRQGGLIANFPLFLLVPVGILLTLRASGWLLSVVLFVAVGPYVLLACTTWVFFGGYSPPARFISVIVPLLAYYVAVALQRLGWWLCVAAATVAAASYAVALTSDVHPDDRFQKAGEHNQPMDRIGDVLGHHFARFLPSSFEHGQARGFWVCAGFTALLTAALWCAAQPWRGAKRDRQVDHHPDGQSRRDEDVLPINA